MKPQSLILLILCICAHRVSSFAGQTPSPKRTPATFNKNKKSTEQKQKGYLNRSSGIKTKRKKPPKWETEGDSLFFLHQSGSSDSDEIGKEFSSPRQLLESKFKIEPEAETPSSEVASKTKEDTTTPTTTVTETPKPKSPFMWGDVSTGPILSPKLNALYNEPTPIQSQAFTALSKSAKHNANPNVIIASPTGTGKTLAYLLPLLANTKRDAFGRIMIITPTLDLAYQIQRVVDQFWDHVNNYSGLYVVQPPEGEDINQIQGWTVAEMKLCKAPIIAGTPKSLTALTSYCRENNFKLFDDLSTIVLDEADRLLLTELVARGESEKDSLTEQLLKQMKFMGVSFDTRDANTREKWDNRERVRLVCASATVGRTLRRQILEITDASSIEKAAVLVTADDRTGKNEQKRRNSLLPATIEHSYALYEDEDKMVGALWEAMKDLPPARTLVFPGKMGVVKMVEELQAINLECVNTLRDEVHWDETAEENSNDVTSWKNAPIFVVGEKFARGLDVPNVKYAFLAAPPTSAAAYAHLAGRTGRGGNEGNAITLVQGMKEAIRLVSLSNALGVTFTSTGNSDANVGASEVVRTDETTMNTVVDVEESKEGLVDSDDAETNEDLDAVDLNTLTLVQLKEMSREQGLKVSGRKSELIERLEIMRIL